MNFNDNISSQGYCNPLGIKLHFYTREEIEADLIDSNRFDYPAAYPDETSLRFFRDATLKWLFKELYHQPNPNVESLLSEALRRSGDSPRVRHVVDKIRSHYGT